MNSTAGLVGCLTLRRWIALIVIGRRQILRWWSEYTGLPVRGEAKERRLKRTGFRNFVARCITEWPPELDDDDEWKRNPQHHEDFCREWARSQTYFRSCVK